MTVNVGLCSCGSVVSALGAGREKRARGLGQHWLLWLLSQNLPFTKEETWPPRGRIYLRGHCTDMGADFWQVPAWLLWGLTCHKQE